MPLVSYFQLLVVLLGVLVAQAAAQGRPVRVKGTLYNPEYWNSTCKYSALDVPPAEFFAGQDKQDKQQMPVPLHPEGPGTTLFKYPINACFGPTEKYDQNLVAKGRKMPCQYRYNRAFRVDYWEEQPCSTTLLANCYCYAISRYVGGFCIPGGPSNQGKKWTCDLLSKSIVQDGGKVVDRKTVMTKQPTGTHYIAAAISPATSQQGTDFHLWRRDNNGAWSWKSGFTFARNTYSNGTLVMDPSDPNVRKLYPVFCGYFDVNAKTHKLTPSGTRSRFPTRFENWKKVQRWKTNVVKLRSWSAGWFGTYQSVYVGQSVGDVAPARTAAAKTRRDSQFTNTLEAWRSQP